MSAIFSVAETQTHNQRSICYLILGKKKKKEEGKKNVLMIGKTLFDCVKWTLLGKIFKKKTNKKNSPNDNR